MRQTIADIISAGHIHLQETLCDEIAGRMLAHPLVFATRVSTEKPDVYPDCKSVGVEIFRFKQR
jgi:dihydroneopterin aldolase